MTYEAIKDESFVDTWRVELVDLESELVIYIALFTGSGADTRAIAYAQRQNVGPTLPIA